MNSMQCDFGGFVLDPIEPDEDPDVLLAEIAQCAFEGKAMRPALAEWFYGRWKANSVTIKRKAGRKGIGIDRQLRAVWAVESLIDQGVGVERAITTVVREHDLKVSRATVHQWRKWVREGEAAGVQMQRKDDEARVLEHLSTLASQGIRGEPALHPMHWPANPPLYPTQADLERWEFEAEFGPIK